MPKAKKKAVLVDEPRLAVLGWKPIPNARENAGLVFSPLPMLAVHPGFAKEIRKTIVHNVAHVGADREHFIKNLKESISHSENRGAWNVHEAT